MYCSKCGNQLDDNAPVCDRCGAQVITLSNGAKIFVAKTTPSQPVKTAEDRTHVSPDNDFSTLNTTIFSGDEPQHVNYVAPEKTPQNVYSDTISAGRMHINEPQEVQSINIEAPVEAKPAETVKETVAETPVKTVEAAVEKTPAADVITEEEKTEKMNISKNAQNDIEEDTDRQSPVDMIRQCDTIKGGFGDFLENADEEPAGDIRNGFTSDDDDGGDEGKKSHKVIIAIVIAVILLIAAAAVVLYMNKDKILNRNTGKTETTTAAEVEAGMKEYTLGDLVTFSVPDTWLLNDTSNKTTANFYFSDKTDITKPFMIAYTGKLGTITEKDDASDIAKTYLSSTKYSYSSEGTCDVGNGTGFLFTTTTSDAELEILIFSANGRSVTFTYYSHDADSDFSEFDKIIKSISVAGDEDETDDDSDMVTVPDFTGFTQETVEQNSAYKENFTFVFTEEESDKTAGLIIRQSIKEGQEVKKGTKIELFVSKAAEKDEKIILDDYYGKTLDEATKALEDLGMTVKVEYYPNYGDHKEGIVEDSTPLAGTQIEKGTIVTLTVWDKAEEQTTAETTTKAPETTEATTAAPSTGYSKGTYNVTADGGLNMRDAAGTSGTLIVTIPNGTSVTVTEVKDTGSTGETRYWGKVSYNGQTGWVAMGYLSK